MKLVHNNIDKLGQQAYPVQPTRWWLFVFSFVSIILGISSSQLL
ncbi:MAG: hypothetical protein QOD00_1857 [Blastocatellia bacterium]|nr:hypothetical protein [Blastocatellia bacterium]